MNLQRHIPKTASRQKLFGCAFASGVNRPESRAASRVWARRRGKLASGESLYNYFRDYQPCTGRYSQSDPIGIAGGMNTYTYSGATPTKLVDQYGLRPAVCAGEKIIEAPTLRMPDFYSVSLPTGIPFVSANFTIDAFGTVYFGPSVGAGTVFGAQAGWMGFSLRNPPTVKESQDFLVGAGGSVAAGVGNVVSGIPFVDSGQVGIVIGTPGLSYGYNFQLTNPVLGPRTRRWAPGCR